MQQRAISTERLARASARHPWRIVGLWVIVVVIAVMLTGSILNTTTEFDLTNNPESVQGNDILEKRLRGDERPAREIIIVRSKDQPVDDPAYRTFVTSLSQQTTALGPEVIRPESITNFYASQDTLLVSKDRRTTIIPLEMAGDLETAEKNIGKVFDVVNTARSTDGFDVYITGNSSIAKEVNKVSEDDLIRGETFGVVIALIILVLVFGAVVAALLPIVLALVSITIATGLAALVSQAFELSFFVTNMITLIGLAVGIDYSLFLVHRFREERQRGLAKEDAIARSASTAGRAVFFSGLTVVLALIGMVIVPNSIFLSLGIGAIFVTLVSVLGSLTLLPALLGLLGDRINKLSIPLVGRAQATLHEQDAGGFWDRVSHLVMGRPVISLFVSAGLLIALAVPYFDLNRGFADIGTLPEDLQSRQGFDILDQEFSTGRVSPAEVVIDGPANSPAVLAAIERLKQRLATDSAFAAPLAPSVSQDGTVTLLPVPVNGEPSGAEAVAAIKRLRRQHIPQAFQGVAEAKVYVAGDTAFSMDFFRLISDVTPIVFAFVLALSFLLLTLVFRSLVVPLKAIILNMLSVSASYGLMVMVFQKGWGNEFFGFQQVPTIEAWIPLFLFSVLFGLSMDYHVFLLSRIREEYDRTGDNPGSVAFGIRSTGRLITGAALIMVAVFAGFASGELVGFQQMGFGLGVAVLLDATIIRMALVPSGMALLGKVNWYFPKSLRWLPDVRVESGRPARVREPVQMS